MLILNISTEDAETVKYEMYRLKTGHKTQFVVSCSWGRFQKFSHQKQFLFEGQDELSRFIQSLLKLLKRHDYVIVGRSSTFLNVQALHEIPSTQFIPLQVTLF